MSTGLPPILLKLKYEETAQAYLRSLPLEHFMESITQAQQRKITLESFDVLSVRCPEVQVFNELLIQYPFGRHQEIRQVVPDNMIIKWPEPIKAEGSYNLPFQPTGPLCVMEYVSKSNKRKDYEESFRKYEREVKVPYYLVFYPDNQELTLFHLRGGRYRTVKPNERGRLAIPELELEAAILDGWVRFWFRGELLPLSADLQLALDEARRQTQEALRRAEDEKRRAEDEKRRAEDEKRRADAAEKEVARLRAEVEKLRKQ